MRAALGFLLLTTALHAASYLGATSFILENATVADTAADVEGNVYIAGSSSARGAFVMKLSPDLRERLYLATLNGDGRDTVAGLAVTPDGYALITGETTSSDFPITPAVYQETRPLDAGNNGGFVAKLDPEGNIVYATFFGGDSPNVRPSGMATNAAGEAFVTGTYTFDDFPLTENALRGERLRTFVVRLNADGTDAIYSLTGHGGRRIAVDAENNAIVTGHAGYPPDVPTTEGAFHTDPPNGVHCAGGKLFAIPCDFQFVHKIDPTGAQLLFGTFLDGSYGALNETVLVDSADDIYLGGSTISPDFPTIEGAFQRVNRVPYPPELVGSGAPPVGPTFGYSRRRPTNGFVAKLSADGSRLIFSTYLGGTVYDAVNDLALLPDGSIAVSGGSQSPDLPGLGATPYQCALPNYVLRLSDDGTSASNTTGLFGAASLALDRNGEIIAAGSTSRIDVPMTEGLYGVFPTPSEVDGGVYVARFSLDNRPATALACIHDSADDTPLGVLAPGHLVTLFGTNLEGEVRVLFDGRPGRLLYESAGRINAAGPFEIAGQEFTVMDLEIDGATVARERLRVVGSAPSLFMHLADLNGPCYNIDQWGPQVFSLTGDVHINTCAEPAKAGSTVSLFLNGVGREAPPLALVEARDRFEPLEVEWAQQDPPEVWRIEVRLPDDADSRNAVFRLQVGDVPARTPSSFNEFRIPFEP